MSRPAFTVVGGRGYIGSHLVREILARGLTCDVPADGVPPNTTSLGHVIYCAGVTADFRTRPFDAVRAHVTTFAELVAGGRFESLVYLSSTRVYKRHYDHAASEDDPITVAPGDFDDLYALSKLLGEAVAALTAARTHVVRLSNVYGGGFDQPTFLNAILKEALVERHVTLRSPATTGRDYIAIGDAVSLILQIAMAGTCAVYNVASGQNMTSGDVLEAVERLTGCRVTLASAARAEAVPTIDISRVRREFGAAPRQLTDELPAVVEACRRYWMERGLNR